MGALGRWVPHSRNKNPLFFSSPPTKSELHCTEIKDRFVVLVNKYSFRVSYWHGWGTWLWLNSSSLHNCETKRSNFSDVHKRFICERRKPELCAKWTRRCRIGMVSIPFSPCCSIDCNHHVYRYRVTTIARTIPTYGRLLYVWSWYFPPRKFAEFSGKHPRVCFYLPIAGEIRSQRWTCVRAFSHQNSLPPSHFQLQMLKNDDSDAGLYNPSKDCINFGRLQY